jgi:gamma-glutamyltranspeptidase / glutathione hydrolase
MAGAIAAGHPLTADAGARVLASGGNAVDALITAACTAFVVEGPLTGPTGGGFLLVHADGATTLLDCFFAVPAERLGVMEEVVIDFADASTQTFHVGVGSVAVPGLLRGLEAVHRDFASRPWSELVEPAEALAREGVTATAEQAFLHGILEAILQRTEAGRRVYGNPSRLHTAELAVTLAAVRERGAAVAAELLPEFERDLAGYDPAIHEPLRARFDGCEVVTTPTPSRGGAVVCRALAALAPDAADQIVALADALSAAYDSVYAKEQRPTGTTHISVIDASGTAAALSSTLGSGSGVFRGGTQLNNMLGELDVIGEHERPPGERLPSMMTPTLVLKDGRPRLLLGSAGSVRLAGAIVQVAVDVIARGVGVAEAIAAPRIHPDGRVIHVEGGSPEGAVASLARAGYETVGWGGRNLFFGGVSAVEVRPDGELAAAGDPRRGGAGVVIA